MGIAEGLVRYSVGLERTQDLVLAFMERVFGQTGVALAEWPERYRAITGTFIDRVPSSS